ncbi:MAG: DUF6458 family protein [Solirubrobacteraceae bacterium]|jgi:hypothetical protein
MTLGTSLFLIAVGAILRFAVTTSVSGIDLQVVGLILMIVGVIGAILSVVWMFFGSRRSGVRDDVVTRDRRDVYY